VVTRKERVEILVDAALEAYYGDDRNSLRDVIRRVLHTWGRELMMAEGRPYDDEDNDVEFENEETP
jgi:hypothetical protein